MTELNTRNERIMRDCCRWQKEAQGNSETTVDALRKAISRFGDYVGARDFGTVDRGAVKHGRRLMGDGGLVVVEAPRPETGKGLTRRLFSRGLQNPANSGLALIRLDPEMPPISPASTQKNYFEAVEPMTKLNPKNERIKRDYCRWQKEAQGKSEATVDAIRKALSRFEDYTGAKDFGTFNREQAIGFKRRLAETGNARSGETISLSTQTATLNALKEFFRWLAWQPGFKSKIHVPDIEYLTPSIKDATAAKAGKLRDYPSLEQIRAVVGAMPTETAIDRRNRALIAFTILTGIRDRALASLSLFHVDMSKTPPLVRQEPGSVATKFAKAIVTYFFPVGDDFRAIVSDWIAELRTECLFAPNDPLFPRTHVAQGNDPSFRVVGVEPIHWADASPIRSVFKSAFARIGLPYFPPHSFRHTLVHHMEAVCRTPEQIKAWSQNLGHEHVATTLTSYGRIDPHRQGEVIGRIGDKALIPAELTFLEKFRKLLREDAGVGNPNSNP